MRRLSAVTALALIAACSAESSPEPETGAAVEAQLEALAGEFPGLSVTVLSGEETAMARTFGVVDTDTGAPVDQDTRFNIYSVSKLVTGLAFLRRAHEGALDLDAPVTTVIDDLPEQYQAVTLRHLLTHNSGIRHYNGREDWIAFSDRRCESPRDAIDYFSNDPLTFAAGEGERYTTFGLVLASQALMELEDAPSFDAALQSALGFDPGMRLDSETQATATPYFDAGVELQSLAPMSAECKFGGGGLIASSAELAEIGRAAYDGRIAPAPALRALLESGRGAHGETSFAMGYGVAEFDGYPDGVLYLTMGGGSPGGRGYLLVLVEPRISVAITGNVEGDGDAVAEVALALARQELRR